MFGPPFVTSLTSLPFLSSSCVLSFFAAQNMYAFHGGILTYRVLPLIYYRPATWLSNVALHSMSHGCRDSLHDHYAVPFIHRNVITNILVVACY